MPDSWAYPIAAGTPESGTGITTSAVAGASRASCAPLVLRTSYPLRPPTTESGRAKKMYSKMQGRAAIGGDGAWEGEPAFARIQHPPLLNRPAQFLPHVGRGA